MVSESPMIESEVSQLERATVDVQPTAGATAGPLSLSEVHLGQTDLGITQATTYAALVAQEADYTGYAGQVIVWGDPTTAADGTVEVIGVALLFAPTGTTTTNNVYNFWIEDTGGTKWYFAGPIVGGPLPMASALDVIQVTVRYRPASGTILVTVA